MTITSIELCAYITWILISLMMLRPRNQWLWTMLWVNMAIANRQCAIRSSPMHKGQGGGTGPICVTDYDFENTNVEKVCILAQMQAAIHILNDGSVKGMHVFICMTWRVEYCVMVIVFDPSQCVIMRMYDGMILAETCLPPCFNPGYI